MCKPEIRPICKNIFGNTYPKMLLLILLCMMLYPLNIFGFENDMLNSVADISNQWIQFKLDHLKNYNTIDDAIRFDIFKKNIEMIKEHNKRFINGLIHYKLGINKFADMTKDEFVKRLSTKGPRTSRPRNRRWTSENGNYRNETDIPEMVDWRNEGAVTEVKDQLDCSACWSFSAVGAIESQQFLKTGDLVSLSAQNLVDCAENGDNDGCNGGWMGSAFEFLQQHELCTEAEYPYEAKKNGCKLQQTYSNVSIKAYKELNPGDEVQLKDTVATTGPISAALDASNLQFYSSGIFSDEDCDDEAVNHGVVVVGYGSENGKDYWLVKNSWGEKWGEQGYFKIIRNMNNNCNIASYGMYPIL